MLGQSKQSSCYLSVVKFIVAFMVQIKNTVQVDVSYILALEHNNGQATVGSSLCSRAIGRRRFSLNRLSGVLAISLDERPDGCT